MIFRLMARQEQGNIIWEWQYRKSFKVFSRWHEASDCFDFKSGKTYFENFDLNTFLFCSRVSLSNSAKIQAYTNIENTDIESDKYIEVFRAHQTKLRDEWFEI